MIILRSYQKVSHATKEHDLEAQFHTLADGRALAYNEYGDPSGHPVFYAHGGPGSRLEGQIFHEVALQYGIRIIATDRPGMGQSTLLPNRTLLDYPKDIASLADALSIERFGVLGWSGGGAHTTVCAYAIPDRLTFNITLAGYTNLAEMPNATDLLESKIDRVAVRLAQIQSPLFGFFFHLARWSILYFPNMVYSVFEKSVSDTDRVILSDIGLKPQYIDTQKEAFAQGARGNTIDAQVHYDDWGFRLNEIPGRIHVFHGTDDPLVPFAYAEHLAANVPHCELHILQGQGHLFPIDHQALIFETALEEIATTP